MPLKARDLQVGDVLDRQLDDDEVTLWNPPPPRMPETISAVEVHDTYVKVTLIPCGHSRADCTIADPVLFLGLDREVHPLNRRKDKQ